jgi:hypothetical protein
MDNPRIRSLAFCLPLAMLLAAACSAGPGDDATGGGGEGGGSSSSQDADGDGISDADEGSGDADGDGKPNAEDEDSDGDGILDSIEAGDGDVATEPVDSDEDDTPDFLDDDSDDNGILDQDEGLGDFDEDGTLDFADGDDDGDTISDAIEIVGSGADCDGNGETDPEASAEAPNDCDDDGSEDYHDLDSDDDSIADVDESTDDTDGDGIRDRYDADSDDDGIPDEVEAGDSDLDTPPVDSDDDDTPDYRDEDSDNDGLDDSVETELGTDPTNVDSDGDGVSDLIEDVAGTDPTNETDNPQANGDFVFIVPYQEPTTPTEDTVRFRTNIQFADVYFAFDTTGSMTAELSAMQGRTCTLNTQCVTNSCQSNFCTCNSQADCANGGICVANRCRTGVPLVVNQLECADYGGTCNLDVDCGNGVCFENHCIQDPNAGLGCIPDVWTGVGRFDDINTYTNLVSLQPDPVVTSTAVPGTGGGGAESVLQPPHCISNPALCPARTPAQMGCAASGIGCPGFRPEAIRIYVQITDADEQCDTSNPIGDNPICNPFTAASAGAALIAADIKFVSLWGTSDDSAAVPGTAQTFAEAIAQAAMTLDSNGDPFVYGATDADVVPNTITAIKELARGKALNTTIGATDAMDGASDTIDATQFIDYLEVNIAGMNGCEIVTPTADTDADTHDDAFPVLYPGKNVCWDVIPILENTTVPATDEPQIYRAILTVRGDGSPLDERDVYFVVPPADAVIAPPR